MKIGDFFVQLGVKADTLTLRDFANSMADIPLKAASAIATLAGIDLAIIKIGTHAMDTGASLKVFSNIFKTGTDQLQLWQNAAKMAGVSEQSVGALIASVEARNAQQNLFGSVDSKTLRAYGALGIAQGAPPEEVLETLRKRYKTMDKAMFRELASIVGSPDEMMAVYAMGDEDWARARRIRRQSRDQIEANARGKELFHEMGAQFWGITDSTIGNILNIGQKQSWGYAVPAGIAQTVLEMRNQGKEEPRTVEQNIDVHFHSTAPIDEETGNEVGRHIARELNGADQRIRR